MDLKRDSLLVKWTYLTREYSPPSQTTICRFFWRAFFFMPLLALMAMAVVAGIGYAIYKNPGEFGILVGILALIVAIVAVGSYLEESGIPLPGELKNKVRGSILVQGFKSVKSKICPIIYIK